MTEPTNGDRYSSRKLLITFITMGSGMVGLFTGHLDGTSFVALMLGAGSAYIAGNAWGKGG